ncbi:hypothetical protein B0H13DRAFT_1538861, partial [Mycena leptocephala]
ALKALEKLPWDGNVQGFRGGGFVNDFALWFTRDWLNTDHEDQMLELLASDLGISDGSTTCIQPTYFVRGLAQAYCDPESYQTARRFGWLRKLGASFAMKDRKRLGSIANKNEDHWVALGIDCERKAIGYGDGFRTKLSASLRKHLDWWLIEHLSAEFKWTDIPVVKQSDPHSCGILAYFAMAHWFDSERFPLPKCTATSMVEEHIRMFLRIVERHERKADFASDARDYEFTFAHSLGLGNKSTAQDIEDDGDNEERDEVKSESSPPGSEQAPHDDDADSVSGSDSDI